jgi:hypothetical protein
MVLMPQPASWSDRTATAKAAAKRLRMEIDLQNRPVAGRNP